jgi:hypothetical protein
LHSLAYREWTAGAWFVCFRGHRSTYSRQSFLSLLYLDLDRLFKLWLTYWIKHHKFASGEVQILGHHLKVVFKHLNDILSLRERNSYEKARGTLNIESCDKEVA